MIFEVQFFTDETTRPRFDDVPSISFVGPSGTPTAYVEQPSLAEAMTYVDEKLGETPGITKGWTEINVLPEGAELL